MSKKTLSYWQNGIAFYFDAIRFVYKRNPFKESTATQGKIWRRVDKGLAINCTARGAHIGSGGKIVRLLVAMSHNKGVILCELYIHMDGSFFHLI